MSLFMSALIAASEKQGPLMHKLSLPAPTVSLKLGIFISVVMSSISNVMDSFIRYDLGLV